MQDIAFAIGHFTEWCLKLLTGMGWVPVTLISITLFFGLVYWLVLQGRYNRRAKQENKLA